MKSVFIGILVMLMPLISFSQQKDSTKISIPKPNFSHDFSGTVVLIALTDSKGQVQAAMYDPAEEVMPPYDLRNFIKEEVLKMRFPNSPQMSIRIKLYICPHKESSAPQSHKS